MLLSVFGGGLGLPRVHRDGYADTVEGPERQRFRTSARPTAMVAWSPELPELGDGGHDVSRRAAALCDAAHQACFPRRAQGFRPWGGRPLMVATLCGPAHES